MKKPEKDEIDQRRAEVEAELAARKRKREEALAAMERKKQEDAAKRVTQGPDPEIAEAVRRARERALRERMELLRHAFQKEASKRNPDEKLEKRLVDEHADVNDRHLACWARLQDSLQGSDEMEKREALKDMAHAWREREDLLAAVAKGAVKSKKKKAAIEEPTVAASLKAKLATLSEQRKAALASMQKKSPKVKRKKKPAAE